MNFHQNWIPSLVALETLGCWRHLISEQLCPRGLLGTKAPLGLCSTFWDIDFSLTQQLQGGSDCSSLELILVHIQPRPFELSFLSSNAHLCHRATAPDFGFLTPQGGCLLFAWQSGRGSSDSSNPSQKKVNGEYPSGHCITVCYWTQLLSSCIVRWIQTDSAQLHYQFPPDLPSPLTSVLHEAEKLQDS